MNNNTPFRAVSREELEVNGSQVIKGANGDEVAFVTFDEDAAFIVKAANSHEKLVAALKEMLLQYDNSVTGISYACADKARAALAAAVAQ